MKSTSAVRRPPYLGYCLVAIVLFGCYVMLDRFREDNSGTVAPTLKLQDR